MAALNSRQNNTVLKENISEMNNSKDTSITSAIVRDSMFLCPLCKQDLQQPRQLRACYHIVCHGCLQQHMDSCQGGEITCPACHIVCSSSNCLSSNMDIHVSRGLQLTPELVDTDADTESFVWICLECGRDSCDGCQKSPAAGGGGCIAESPTAYTPGGNEKQKHGEEAKCGSSQVHACPICRNTATECPHEQHLHHLSNDELRKDTQCHIKNHEGKLIAYCVECSDAICSTCSMIEHKQHETHDIGKTREPKQELIASLIKHIDSKLEDFTKAVEVADIHEEAFQHNLEQTKQKLAEMEKKALTEVKESFATATGLVEQKSQKYAAELKALRAQMGKEKEFLQTTLELGATALKESAADVEVVRVAKLLNNVAKDLGVKGQMKKVGKQADTETQGHVCGDCEDHKQQRKTMKARDQVSKTAKAGEKTIDMQQIISPVETDRKEWKTRTQAFLLETADKHQNMTTSEPVSQTAEDYQETKKAEVLPLKSFGKQFVLPLWRSVIQNPQVLQNVGMECVSLHRTFVLKAKDELLLSHSILPLSETEALVSCKPCPSTASLVLYSNTSNSSNSKRQQHLKDDGQYHITQLPDGGIVATLYQPGRRRQQVKTQVLLWDPGAVRHIMKTAQTGQGADVEVESKVLAETGLPPHGVAVTPDNHLAVCTAGDPACADGGKASQVLLLSMTGGVLCRTNLPDSYQLDTDKKRRFRARYITCNINKDICITSERDRAVLIYDNHLTEKYKIHNPYQDHRQNEIFCPRGICHDSFGRLIVADANNHAVLRVSVGEDYLTSEPQIILQNGVNGLEDFFFPTLVAMGPGDKLWVVCRNNIHVFNYME